ncbi:hypothetical protein VDGL01_02569 [Verticillium dahliae]
MAYILIKQASSEQDQGQDQDLAACQASAHTDGPALHGGSLSGEEAWRRQTSKRDTEQGRVPDDRAARSLAREIQGSAQGQGGEARNAVPCRVCMARQQKQKRKQEHERLVLITHATHSLHPPHERACPAATPALPEGRAR